MQCVEDDGKDRVGDDDEKNPHHHRARRRFAHAHGTALGTHAAIAAAIRHDPPKDRALEKSRADIVETNRPLHLREVGLRNDVEHTLRDDRAADHAEEIGVDDQQRHHE